MEVKYNESKKVTLLLIACIVWMAAGFNIFRIGLIEYPPYLSIFNLCLSIIVFTVFQYFIFGKLVKRHTKRILNYKKDYQFFLKFFDLKSFAIMAFYDDSRYLSKSIWIVSCTLYCSILFRSRVITSISRDFVWMELF